MHIHVTYKISIFKLKIIGDINAVLNELKNNYFALDIYKYNTKI